MLYLSFLILKPFMIAIVSSFLITFLFYPVYKKILDKIKSENLSALIISILIVLIITIPTIFLINSVSREVTELYKDLTLKLTQEKDLISLECLSDSSTCKAIKAINENPKIRFYVSGAITNLASGITRESSNFLFSIPKKVIDVLIIFVLVFFLLKGGKGMWDKLRELVPLKESHKDRLLKRFSDTIDGVVYGYFIIAILEGVVGWLAFALIGSKMALMLGIIIGILGLIPTVGAPLIWVPASLIFFFGGSPIKAAILVAGGLIMAFLGVWGRARIIGNKTDVHPVIVALGILGGTLTFGLIGFIIGPLILSLLITSVEIYKEEKDSFLI